MTQEKSKNLRFRATIYGKVQGVGFRYFVLENSKLVNVTGWVRNRFNGTVEIVSEGKKSNLEEFLTILNQGSSSSNISKVEVEWLDTSNEFSSFKIRMTR